MINAKKYKEYAKILTESLRSTANLKVRSYREIKETKTLLKLVRRNMYVSRGDDKLVKLGAALTLLVPEPVITNIVGATMIALGLKNAYKRKTINATLREVIDEIINSSRSFIYETSQ